MALGLPPFLLLLALSPSLSSSQSRSGILNTRTRFNFHHRLRTATVPSPQRWQGDNKLLVNGGQREVLRFAAPPSASKYQRERKRGGFTGSHRGSKKYGSRGDGGQGSWGGSIARPEDMRRSWEKDDHWNKFESKFKQRVAQAESEQQNTNRLSGVVRMQRATGHEGEHFYSTAGSFAETGLDPKLLGSLMQAGITRPSRIQKISMPALIEGKSAVLGEQTGSGKTLAYLLPLMHRLLTMQKNGEIPRWPSPRKPRIVVVAPTSELAAQVKSVAFRISQSLDIRTMCFTKDRPSSKLEKEGVDLLVATPGSLMHLINTRKMLLDDVFALVMDEADIQLLDQTFPTAKLLRTFSKKAGSRAKKSSAHPNKEANRGGGVEEGEKEDKDQASPVSLAPSSSSSLQNIFVSATFPPRILEMIQDQYPHAEMLAGPGLHRVSPAVDFSLVDCTFRDSRRGGFVGGVRIGGRGRGNQQVDPEAMALQIKKNALVEQLGAFPCERTLVFCNTIQTCRDVENFLNRRASSSSSSSHRGDLEAALGKGRGGDSLDSLASSAAAAMSPSGSMQILAFHGAIDPKRQKQNFAAFVFGSGGEEAQQQQQQQRGGGGGGGGGGGVSRRRVMITSGRASKGFDFDMAPVDHVVLFDWPRDNIEIVRRIGRTGRAGRRGRVTILARGPQVSVAKRMIDDFARSKKLDAAFAQWDTFSASKDEEARERAEARRKKKEAAKKRAERTGWGGQEAQRWDDFSDVSEDSDEEYEDDDEFFAEGGDGDKDTGRFWGGDEERDPRRISDHPRRTRASFADGSTVNMGRKNQQGGGVISTREDSSMRGRNRRVFADSSSASGRQKGANVQQQQQQQQSEDARSLTRNDGDKAEKKSGGDDIDWMAWFSDEEDDGK